MAQSLSQLLVHIVFATKDRYPFINANVRGELESYAASVLRTCESPAVVIYAMPNHMHTLCRLAKTWCVARLIQDLKANTSRWIKGKGGMLQKFQWQGGYGAFSVSPSNAEAVRSYIAQQEEHHRRVTFEDELRTLLRKHGIEFNEEYLWN